MGTHQQWKSRSLAPFLSLCFSKDLCIAMVKTSHQFPRTTLVISQFQWTDVDWELLWNNSDCMRNFSMEGIQLSGLAICWCYHGVSTENWKESYLEQWLLFFFFFFPSAWLFLVVCYIFFRASGVCFHQDFIKLSKICLCYSILIVICGSGIMQHSTNVTQCHYNI